MSRSASYVFAALLFLVALCFLGYGFLNVIGSSASEQASLPLGIALILVGLLITGGGVALIISSGRHGTQEGGDTILKLDLPAQIKIDALTCTQCGGALSADNIKVVAGAPMVECPYCGAVYELAEEPKW